MMAQHIEPMPPPEVLGASSRSLLLAACGFEQDTPFHHRIISSRYRQEAKGNPSLNGVRRS